MSDFSTILRLVRANLIQSGVRYFKGTTTLAGSADGNSVICDSLVELDDAWNGVECTLLSGTYAGWRRKVVDFDQSSTELLFNGNVWPLQVGSLVEFELTEPGTWSGDDMKRFIQEGANEFLRLCPVDLLVNYQVREIIGGVAGFLDLPANVLKFVEPILTINGQKVDVLAPERAAYLDEAAYIDPTNGSFIGYFAGRADSTQNVGQFFYKPAVNQDGVWYFVPRAAFDTNGSWKVPEELWEPVAYMATATALLANEMAELASQWVGKAKSYLPRQAETR